MPDDPTLPVGPQDRLSATLYRRSIGWLNVPWQTASAQPAEQVDVAGEVHEVGQPAAGGAGADLAEDDLAVRLPVPLHVRETAREAHGLR